MYLLAFLTLLTSAADHWTTYVCLRSPVEDWIVTEANPIAAWLFEHFGLVPGLLIDSGITLVAVAVLVATPLIPRMIKIGLFGVLISVTGFAVFNNLMAVRAMGLSALGVA